MFGLFENMCRTCMLKEPKKICDGNKGNVEVTEMVSIFVVPEDSKVELSLMDLLKTAIPQLKLEENDQLPKIVCMECLDKIKNIYRFQRNCLSVEQKFYNIIDEHAFPDPLDDNIDNERNIKLEFDNPFDEKNSNSNENLQAEDNMKLEYTSKDGFIESCSDSSVDLDWTEEKNSNWEKEQKKSKFKKTKKPKAEGKVKQARKKSAKVKTIGTQLKYPCDKCNRTLKSEMSYKKHQELHNENKDKEHQIYSRRQIGDVSFLCSDCGKGFSTAVGLRHHTFRHLGKNFSCPECPRAFSGRSNLINHINNVHKTMPKKNVCDICGRAFTAQHLLNAHKRYHNNDKQYACEYCEKSFVTKDKLIRHTRIHTGEKPFKCNYCENAYRQSNELVKHLRCHLGENVYQCQLCPLRFPTVKIVREHFSTHKNDDEETRTRNLAELSAVELRGMNIR